MRLKLAGRVILLLAVTTGFVSVAVFSWMKLAPRRVPEGQRPLSTLGADSLPAFRDAFNAEMGQVRLLVMLSPT